MNSSKNSSKLNVYKELLQYKKEWLNLRFQKTLGNLKNTARIKFVKKKIAIIHTILNKKK